MIRRGTPWPWDSLVDPPEGWVRSLGSATYAVHRPIVIVATRDSLPIPQLPEEYVAKVETQRGIVAAFEVPESLLDPDAWLPPRRRRRWWGGRR